MMRAALVGTGTVVGVGAVLALNPTGAPVGGLTFPLVAAGTTTQNGAAFGPKAPTAGAITGPAVSPSTSRPTPTPSVNRSSAQPASHSSPRATPAPANHVPSGAPSRSAPAPVRASAPPPSPTPKPTPTSATAIGQPVDVGYGIVQVQATVTGGRLVDIQAVQMPLSDPISYQKSTDAWPVLVQEALQAQSAQIAGVTGATYTSYGFAQSLKAALMQLGHAA